MKLRTLRGLRIVVTRAAHQAAELADPLRALGAQPILLPLIGIAPPADPQPLLLAASQTNQYDWIVFTSVNSVTSLLAEIPETGEWLRPRIATIGAATHEAAEQYGLRVHLTPSKYVAEALVEAFSQVNLDGKRILIPSAAVTRDVVAPALREMGAAVDVVEAYRNVLPPEAAHSAKRIFCDPLPNWITFASSSAAVHLAQVVDNEIPRQMRIASIGPATSETIREQGWQVAAEANVYTIQGLIEAMQSAV